MMSKLMMTLAFGAAVMLAGCSDEPPEAAAPGGPPTSATLDPASVAYFQQTVGDRVFFETTKEAKLARICACACTHFIDDLPEFLTLADFPPGVERILFDPVGRAGACENVDLALTSWREIREHLLQ